MSRAFSTLCAVLSGMVLSPFAAGCRFDLDKIYEYERADAGTTPGDAGVDAGTEPVLPAQLIDLWKGQANVDADCVSCVKSSCKAVNESCRDDAECAGLTRCVAQGTDPDTQAGCRVDHLDWIAEDPYGRALGGPFYVCAFRDKCASQCSTRTDFSCLGKFSWELTSDTSITSLFQFVNALDQQPAAGISAKVCRAEDLACEAPSDGPVVADAEGKAELTLPTALRSFSGYLELSGGVWYPTLVRFGWPLARPGVTNLPIVTAQSVAQNSVLLGIEPDATRGQVQIRMFGCAGVGMRGVYFEASANRVDDQTRTWYATPLPSFDENATGDLGSGGIIDVKPGLVDIVAKLRSDDTVVARTSVPVRAGYLTIAVLAPLPDSQ